MAGRYKITTFGCQMNKSDSERLRSIFSRMRMIEVDDGRSADVIIFNTCSVRQMAEDRVYGQLRVIRELKQINPRLIVAVTGCMAGRDVDGKIRARMKEVDLFFPTHEMVYLPQRIAELNSELVSDDLVGDEFGHYLTIRPSYPSSYQAFVSISTGCNKFCTYCVVPFSRGLQKDRPAYDVISEVRELAEKNYLEVTLLGQTVNWYRIEDFDSFSQENPYLVRDKKANNFAALLWELNQLPSIDRIHFTAPHPLYMTDDVIDAMTLPKQVNYLHLPVQSGNNEILKKMNRPYTREFYLDVIDRLYKKMPSLALGTDIIVGFSSETEEQFQETVSLYEICQFDISYHAMYSVRSGTLAAKRYADDVSLIEKKRRWQILQDLMKGIVLKKNQCYVGQILPVLVDSCEKGVCGGNTREMKRVSFSGSDNQIGKIVPVKIDRGLEWMLYGSAV